MTEKRNAISFLVDKIEHPGKPGAILFAKHPEDGRVVGFSHACPCGCGRWSFIRLDRTAWAPDAGSFWERSGDDLHMTLTPSIGIFPQTSGAWHWHGYLRAGVFEEC